MRIGEAVGLQWGDLDLDARIAHVRRTCKGARISTPKSGKGRRVHLTPQVCEALRALHRERRVLAIDDSARAREWVFPEQRKGRTDRPMQYRRFYDLFVPLAKSLGLRGVTPHTLRHTYASLLFAQGKTMHFVQEQHGHHDPKFTASVYGHLIPTGMARWISWMAWGRQARSGHRRRERPRDVHIRHLSVKGLLNLVIWL